MRLPLVLDFDGSVLSLPEERRVPLREWQEVVRFGCSLRALRALEQRLAADLRALEGPVFLGSGDFHHVSLLLIERLRALGTPVRVIVFDNHPDNMRYLFGIHCGSWVRYASQLPHVAGVHVFGICSRDVEGVNSLQNYLLPLRSGKISYGCVGRNVQALRRLGAMRVRSFSSVSQLVEGLAEALPTWREPIYLSIDKDVLSTEDVRTNWDQGVMHFSELLAAVEMLRDRLVGCDVTGENSTYRYRSPLKRLLSGLDGQSSVPPMLQNESQAGHRALNLALLRTLVR